MVVVELVSPEVFVVELVSPEVVVVELVVRGERDQTSPARRQREENLHRRVRPNLRENYPRLTHNPTDMENIALHPLRTRFLFRAPSGLHFTI